MKKGILIVVALLLLIGIPMIYIVKSKFDYVDEGITLVELQQQLSGSYQTIGVYKNEQPQYDTLFLELDNRDLSKVKVEIWTDSGKFVHTIKDTTLLSIEPLEKVEIMELDFVNAGEMRLFNVSRTDSSERLVPFNQSASLIKLAEKYSMVFQNNDGSVDTTLFEVRDSTLIIKYKQGYDERFVRRTSWPEFVSKR